MREIKMINENVEKKENEKNEINEKEIEKIRKHAKYLSTKLYGIRFFNGKEIRKLFKNEIIPILEKQDVNFSISFLTGEEGLMTLIDLAIQNGFSFRRDGEGQRYQILPELQRLVNNRYEGYKYFLQQYDNYSADDLERIDERNYACGLNEVEILVYKSHLDSIVDKDIVIRFIDYVDYDTLL